MLPSLSVDLVKAARKSSELLSSLPVEVLGEMEVRYRKFLRLVQKYPDVPLSPACDIDEMWHLHMLHPRAYIQDCMNLFGRILDHNGGFGSTEEERPVLIRYANETEEYWKREYGEEYFSATAVRVKRLLDAVKRAVASEGSAPEAKEGTKLCVVAPEAKEGAKLCVVAPEANEGAKWCVYAPEAKEGAKLCVVAPEANEGVKLCVVAPEANEGVKLCVVGPEANEGVKLCVVAPEANEGVKLCVVRTAKS
ncbi:glycine-rich domain-containing protein [Staphylospora marina]|uniref:glycine-rich domain-containing protein n=1 Tax=Staphylospora marina TaxID=2490858 RepID=UPI000F5B92F1|nr:glycine-rich domain-containing protein-like [Staphylospora marina]